MDTTRMVETNDLSEQIVSALETLDVQSRFAICAKMDLGHLRIASLNVIDSMIERSAEQDHKLLKRVRDGGSLFSVISPKPIPPELIGPSGNPDKLSA
jgi:hypothetical protein